MNKLSFKFIPKHRHLLGKEDDVDVIVTVPDQIQVFIKEESHTEARRHRDHGVIA